MSKIKKKFWVLACAFVFVSMFYANSIPAKAASYQNAKITASTLNVRSTPSTKSAILWKLSKGQIVKITQTSKGWAKIDDPKKKDGWVSADYLQPMPVQVKTPAATTKSYYVNASGLYLRKEANTKAQAITLLPNQTKVVELSRNGSWSKITYKPYTGWVSNKYLTDKAPAASKPSVPVPQTKPKTIVGKTIVLDAGHGGTDPGSAGYSPALKKAVLEKDLTLMMVQKTAALLKDAGANVILTRSSDTYPSLQARVDLAEKYHADAFVSVHYNAGSSTASGLETYYYTQAKDQKLADCIQREMVKATSMRDRGVKKESLHVVRENSQPAVLLELGFISNQKELDTIISNEYQITMSNAICNGLKNYFY
ncbi:N-acetylmuramoyl-L-alanine amidase [Peribacillus kribbensis]|uniref:N-acetylmuramoyl-L-alanine amidase n=1 Tax=Peribacillus kribbensis TaxID=356658 RepID=UPI00138ABB18|nr:N-acetylmuramoyl-L-alanine amidase [Peribacillus kribbensis]